MRGLGPSSIESIEGRARNGIYFGRYGLANL
jgi:hypothetical protein